MPMISRSDEAFHELFDNQRFHNQFLQHAYFSILDSISPAI